MDFVVMPASETMLPQIERIEQACFSVPWTRAQRAPQLDESRCVFLAAVRGGEVLGYVNMLYVLDEGYIGNVAVAPDSRRMGVGRALIAALLERAAQLGRAFATLEVRPSNAPAVELYRGFGFEEAGRRKNYYEKPSEDALLMTKFRKGGSAPC